MAELPVLLVDDEAQVRSLIRVILSKNGYSVVEAAGGLQGLAVLRDLQGRIGLIVTAYGMWELDGVSFARRCKDDFPFIPILLMSSNQQLAACTVPDGFIEKPFEPSALLRKVRRLLPRGLRCA